MLTYRNTIKNHSSLYGHSSSNLTVPAGAVGGGGGNGAPHRDSMSMLTLSDDGGGGGHVAVISGGGGGEGAGDNANNKTAGAGAINETDRSGFALVVNGHSLVYALSDDLELLFLAVAEQCNGRK